MMTLGQFLKHRWLEFSRSPALATNLIGLIFMVLTMLMLFFSIVLIGYLLDLGAKEVAPEINPFDFLISLLQIIFVLDFILRPLSALRLDLPIAPYLFLMVKKKRLAVFIVWEYFGGVGNLLMLTLLGGLSWKIFLFSEEPLRVFMWIIYFLLFLLLTTNFKLLVSRLLLENGFYRLVPCVVLLVLGTIIYLTNANLIASFDHFLVMTEVQLGWMCVILSLINMLLFVINRRSILRTMYID